MQRLLDAVGHPQERQLPQSAEVPLPEVVPEGRVDLFGRVDVPVGHAPAERMRCHVDELLLVGGPHDLVGDRLSLRDPGDALDDVVHGLEVLDVHGRDHVDARGQQLLDVLPSLRVARPGHVRVRELIDERDLRRPCQSVDVHLLERRASILDRAARQHFEVRDLLGGARTTMGLDETHDDVGAARSRRRRPSFNIA